ncbi:hypothetical protein Tco_0870335 [Tanacetum coccineum]
MSSISDFGAPKTMSNSLYEISAGEFYDACMWIRSFPDEVEERKFTPKEILTKKGLLSINKTVDSSSTVKANYCFQSTVCHSTAKSTGKTSTNKWNSVRQQDKYFSKTQKSYNSRPKVEKPKDLLRVYLPGWGWIEGFAAPPVGGPTRRTSIAVEKKILEEDVEKLVEGEDESNSDEFVDTEIDNDDKKNDDDNHDDAKDDKNDDDDHSLIRTQRMGSSENRTEKMQTPILSPPRSPRTDLSSDKAIAEELEVSDTPMPDAPTQDQPKPTSRSNGEFVAHAPKIIEELFRIYMQNMVLNVHPTTIADPELWNALKAKYEKSSASADSCRYDAFRKRDHDNYQGNNANPEGENDEVILEEETPELINEFQNVYKQVPTNYDHEKMKATIRNMLSSQFRDAEEYAYHLEQAHKFMENQVVWESWQEDLKRPQPDALIHETSFLEEDLKEKMIRWVRKVFKSFNKEVWVSIQHWKNSWHKRMYKIKHMKVRDDPEEDFSNRMIVEIVKVITEQQYGPDFMERIIVMRENDKPNSFYEADFKYLKKNDIEDIVQDEDFTAGKIRPQDNESLRTRNHEAFKSPQEDEKIGVFRERKTNSTINEATRIINP